MSADPEFYERVSRQYAQDLRDGHRLAAESQKHTDKMLTWAIGLMGAGILGSHQILGSLTPGVRALALTPWLLGILVALAGRLVSRAMVEEENLHFFKKIHRMETAVFFYRGEELQREINAVVTNADELGEEREALERLNTWLRYLYYAAHVLLGIGVVVVLGGSLGSSR